MTQMNKTSLSDIPFEEEKYDLGTERYVKGLIKFIKNSSMPITIALQGEWGSGKTSMMARLKRALCSATDDSFIGIDINTWEYSMMSSPDLTVYKILDRLVQELTKDDPKAKNTFKGFLRGVGNVLYRGARESLKTIPVAGGALAVGLEAAGVPTQLPTSEDNETATLSDLRNALKQAVQQCMEKDKKRGVIIFVDDLDRLNPPVAVEILELLKNVFTLDNCIFILAIDYDVVVKGLKPKFGELTDKNEREFRSFFDKIIQVPFSLPVSSYRPIDFALNALVGIGYFRNDLEASDPAVQVDFESIVESSVGKNPRSIKRLINTLSLLDCIDQCGSMPQNNKVSLTEKDEKLVNIIVVAIQICYPRIHKLLVHKPAFTDWDEQFAEEEGIKLDSHTDEIWKDILAEACAVDKYLEQHATYIINLFNKIIEIMDRNEKSDKIGMKLRQVLDKSSVTSINSDFKVEDLNKKDFIYKLHNNIIKRIKTLQPNIKYQLKRNTGNGGIYIWFNDHDYSEITFTPTIDSENNKITLKLWLDFRTQRTERMLGQSLDELLRDEKLASALTALDSVLVDALKKWYFSGRIHDGQKEYFHSYMEELRYCHKMGMVSPGSFTYHPQLYKITLDKPSLFETPDIVDTIARVLIANYDFHKAMNSLGIPSGVRT